MEQQMGMPGYVVCHNLFECALIYEDNSTRTEMVFSHLPGEPRRIVLATFPLTPGDDIPEPLSVRHLSMAEARLRFSFYDYLSQNGLFDLPKIA